MLKKRFTCKREFTTHKKGESVAAIPYSNDSFYVMEEEGKFINSYLVGEVANRLYEYEELGYTPEELDRIITMYKMYKSQSYMTYGMCASVEPNKAPPFYRDIHAIIDTGMKNRDRQVSITFTNMGITVDVIPYPEKTEDTEDDG